VYNTPERTKNVIDGDGFDALLRELERTAEDYWNVGRDNAQLLALLIKSVGARRVLEVGTSNGYSTLWFARALVEEAGPDAVEVVAIENDAARAARARDNFRRAGLDGVITLVEGDARARITGLAGRPFDFVFLDAEKNEYAAYLRAVLPLVRDGGLIVGDDTLSLRDEMAEYVALTREHPDLESVEVPIDDGIIISRKRRRRA
jgi:predicted O-methyltransferase YrrM